MLKHGINTIKEREDPGVIGVQAAAAGIPFYIGAWPCHRGKGFTGKPQLINDFAEAKQMGGYSTEWRNEDGSPKWSLCQAAYAHFVLVGVSPAIFYNVFDPKHHKKSVPEVEIAVSDHIAELPLDAIINDNLTVKSGEDTLVIGTDYEAYYSSTALCVELLEESASYGAATLNIAYDIADLSKITAETIEEAVEGIEKCRVAVGIVPDLICAPGWSKNPTVAAVMAAKAPSINALFRAKAVVDLDSAVVDDYTKVYEAKNNGYNNEDMVVCWPMVKSGDYVFDLSVVTCALIAKVDIGNDDCPYESPSNKTLSITGVVTANGTEVNLTLPQADVVSVSDGVVTVIRHDGWRLWGNYLGCYPENTDPSRMYICTNRVQDWICNTFVNTFWNYVDKPLVPALRDAIVNAFNTWLNGLTAQGKLYGGQIEYIQELNPASQLVMGIFRLDTTAASPVPAQRIDMHIRYSVDMLEAAMSA